MTLVEELLVRFVGDESELEKAAKAADQTVAQFKANAAKGLETVAKAGSAVGLALTGIGLISVKVASDFETSWVGVMQTVNDTEENLAGLRQGIRDMAKDTGFAATQLNGVAKAAGSLGMNASQALAFTKVVSDFARASSSDLPTAQMALEAYVRDAQLAPDKIRPLVSVAVAISNAIGAQDEVLLGIAAKIDGVGKAAGFSAPQTLAFAGALAAIGVDAGRGSMAFNNLLVLMGKAVKTSGKELTGFAQVAGMSAKQFADAWRKDPTIAVTAFLAGLKKFDAQGGDTINGLAKLGLADGQVRETLLKAAAGADKFTQALAVAGREMGDQTALTDQAAIANDSAAVKMAKMKQALNDAAIDLGDSLIPVLGDFVNAIKPVIFLVGELAKGFNSLPTWVKDLVVGLVVALTLMYPALKLVNAGIVVYNGLQVLMAARSATATAAVVAETDALAVMQAAQVGAGTTAVTAAGSLGLLGGAVAGLTGGILGLTTVWALNKTGFFDWLGGLSRGFGSWLGDLAKPLQAGVSLMLAPLVTLGAGIMALIKGEGWDGFVTNLKNAFGPAIDYAKQLPGFFVGIGKGIADGIVTGLKGGWGAVTDWFGGAWDGIKGGVQDAFGIHSPSKVFLGYGQSMTEGLTKGLDGLHDAVTGPIADAKAAAAASFTTTATIITRQAQGASLAAIAPTPTVATPNGGGERPIVVTLVFQDGAIQVPVQSAGSDFDPASTARGLKDAVRREMSDILRSAGTA